MSPILEVGQAVAVVYLMYRQNSHLAEANRIARGRTKSAEPVTRSWQQNLRHYWPLLAMGVLAFASWIPYIFFTPAKELGVTYGGVIDQQGFKIYSEIDSSEMIKHKPNRLMMMARIQDISIDERTDTTVERSRTFEVTSPVTSMQIIPSKPFLNRLKTGTYLISVYVFEVPEDFSLEVGKSISEVEKHGAKRLAGRVFGPVHLLPSMLPPSVSQ